MNWLDAIAANWWAWVWPNFWQFTLLAATAWIIDRAIRGWAWPQVRMAMWLMVAAKLVLPPHLGSPVSLTSGWTDGHAVPLVIEAVASTVDSWLGGDRAQQFMALAGSATDAAIRPQVPQHSGWIVLLFAVWFGGFALLTTLFALRMRHLIRLFERDAARAAVPTWLAELVRETAREMGLRRVPRVLLAKDLLSPAALGVRRPAVLVPVDWLSTMNECDIRHALLHEMAHIRRGDLWVQAALTVVQLLWWFHPGVYIVGRRIAVVREICCDATVAGVLRESTGEYQQTLLRVARQIGGLPRAAKLELVGLFERPADLIARVKALRHNPWQYRAIRGAFALIVACGLAATVLPMSTSKPHPCKPHPAALLAMAE